MPTILYKLTLQEPAIFAALEGEPNSAVSYSFVPGSAIRGALIGHYSRQHKTAIDAANSDHRRLFFSDKTCYLNAYPAFEDMRSLPVPSTWQVPKYPDPDKAVMIRDVALQATGSKGEKPQKPRYINDYYTVADGKTARLYKPRRVLNIHTRRARRSANEQQVFRYDALASGQSFIGAIQCQNEADARLIEQLLTASDQVHLGGARSAGYGRTTVKVLTVLPKWEETPVLLDDAPVILTFLSDTMLQDDRGEYVTTGQAIQTSLVARGINCTVEPVAVRRGLIGGFNRKWGLPLPQVPVVERGSVVRLVNVQASQDAFHDLVANGMGIGTVNGLGRIAVNWQSQEELTPVSYKPEAEAVKQPLSDESKSIWSGMQRRINQRVVDERMTGVIFMPAYTIYGQITRTQLSRLRTVIANALRQDDPSREVLQTFLNGIKGKAAERQFDDARIGNRRLADWLKQPAFPELGQKLQERDYLVLQLVDAVLDRAHKERSN
jgi:CRISPR-associated protein Csx10